MDLKWRVSVNCFPTDHKGNRTEESKLDHQVPESWWLPMQRKAGLDVYQAQWALAALPTWRGISQGSAHKEAFLLWLHLIKVFLKSFRYS